MVLHRVKFVAGGNRQDLSLLACLLETSAQTWHTKARPT